MAHHAGTCRIGGANDAQAVVDEIAKLHARWWENLDGLDWLTPMNNDLYKGYGQVLPDLAALLKSSWGDRLDPAAMPWLDTLCERCAALRSQDETNRSARRAEPFEQCLLDDFRGRHDIAGLL